MGVARCIRFAFLNEILNGTHYKWFRTTLFAIYDHDNVTWMTRVNSPSI